jgi:peptide/nickel transport system substrate-binding protein
LEHENEGDLGYQWLKTNSAGSGAYRLRSWKPNESYVLEANPDYWRGAPAMKRVFVRHIQESSTQRLLLEKGDIDLARNLSPDDVAAVEQEEGIKVESDLKGRILYFSMNQKDPVLSQPKVVEALKYLVDYDGMANSIVRGQYRVHQAFLPLTYLGALEEQPYKYDVEKAKALLKEAGFGEGFDVQISVRNVPDRLAVAQSLQNSFAKAGVRAELVSGTGKQVLTQYRARQHQIYLGDWGPDYPDPHTNADTFAHNPDNSDEAGLTGKLAWRNAWDIPELTKRTEAALLERDPDVRAELYREIQREHQRRSPFVIMFQQVVQSALRAEVEGFITGGATHDIFYWKVTKN